jgi:hypothetical protein
MEIVRHILEAIQTVAYEIIDTIANIIRHIKKEL